MTSRGSPSLAAPASERLDPTGELSRLQLGVTRYLAKVRADEQTLLSTVRELLADVLE